MDTDLKRILQNLYLMTGESASTVDSEIFVRVLMFCKNKILRNGEIVLSFTDIGKSCPSRDFFTSQICLFTLFATISEFTVLNYLIMPGIKHCITAQLPAYCFNSHDLFNKT